VSETARWVDLLDPDRAQLDEALSRNLADSAVKRILAAHDHADEPRPTLESHGDYVFGVFVVAVDEPETDRIYYQEVDLVVTRDVVVTVRKSPPEGKPFDEGDVREACRHPKPPGMIAYHLVDAVAERYLDLIDDLNDEIDELEEKVDEWPPDEVRTRTSHLRHDMLRIRRTLAPTRDAVRRVVDDRIELEGYELFPPEIDVHFSDVYDKLLRATEGLELSRDLLGGVRDYAQSKVSIDQNEVTKRLTAIASLLLLPTFIVGVYGQNFHHHFPELDWQYGYLWSWGLIVATTLGQLWYFRRKRWI
jgi:magnesium transporter